VLVCMVCEVFLADVPHSVIPVSVCVERKCNAPHYYYKQKIKERKLIEKEKFLVMTVAANPCLLKVQVKRFFSYIRKHFCNQRIQCHVSFQGTVRSNREN
jgi:hypothetical protein